MKSLYSCSALSLAYPYFCCKSPRSFSSFPSTWVRSSSVSLPHFSLTPPLISFHFPFRISSFMFALLSSCSQKQGCPANVHLPLCQGPAQRSTPSSLHDLSTLKGLISTTTIAMTRSCLLYTSDAADDLLCVDLGGRRIIKKKKKKKRKTKQTENK